MSPTDPIDHDLIRKLAELISETDLTEIEIEHESIRLRLSRTITQSPQIIHAAPATTAVPVPAPVITSVTTNPEPEVSSANTLKSPMVGTAYLSSEPGTPPFIAVGDTIKRGQTILIIEAMKTMNQIPADRDGIVKAILVDDAQPVEFGEPLIVIE